jgi:hypothetical protein
MGARPDELQNLAALERRPLGRAGSKKQGFATFSADRTLCLRRRMHISKPRRPLQLSAAPTLAGRLGQKALLLGVYLAFIWRLPIKFSSGKRSNQYKAQNVDKGFVGITQGCTASGVDALHWIVGSQNMDTGPTVSLQPCPMLRDVYEQDQDTFEYHINIAWVGLLDS